MSDMRYIPDVTPQRQTSDTDNWAAWRGTRDGAPSVIDWATARSMEGRVFGANMGSLTTPLTFLVYGANRPDAWLRVPDATAIIPLYVNVALEDAAGTDTEIFIIVAANDIGNGTSTAATAGPVSWRTDAPVTSAVTARHLATADTTAATTPIEVFRTTYGSAEGTGNDARNVLWAPRVPPVLMGPASLIVYVAATTTQATGFVQFAWVEVPENMFS